MPLHEAVWQALRTLWVQKLKTFFALLGTLVGVTFLVIVASVVYGTNRFVADLLGDVHSFQVQRHAQGDPPITVDDAARLQARLGAAPVFVKYCETYAAVRSRTRTTNGVDFVAADESYFKARRYEMAAGRGFTAPEVRAGQSVAVVGDEIAATLLPGLDPIGRTVTIGAVPYRIVGVVARQGSLFGFSRDRFMVSPLTSPAGLQACASPRVIGALIVQLADLPSMRLAMDRAETVLRTARRLRPAQPDNFDLSTSQKELEDWNKISRTLFLGLSALVSIALVVGGIVITNIMLMAVAERTSEIGVRRAMGARRRDVLVQFVVEAAVLSSVGALLGVGIGVAVTFAIAAATPLPAAVAPWSVLASMALGLVTGMVAGVYPATRAARLDPITALRAE